MSKAPLRVQIFPNGLVLNALPATRINIDYTLWRVFPCLRDSAHLSSEYFSTRIQSFIESKSELEIALDAEIKASKVHWSVLPLDNGAQCCEESDMEMFWGLRQQYATPDGKSNFFLDLIEDM